MGCRLGFVDCVSALLSYDGVNPNIRNSIGVTPLHEATINGYAPPLFLHPPTRGGSQPQSISQQGLLDGRLKFLVIFLFLCLFFVQLLNVWDRYSAVIELLLKHKADINIPNNEERTALHFAVKFGHLSCVQLLLKFGAEINGTVQISLLLEVQDPTSPCKSGLSTYNEQRVPLPLTNTFLLLSSRSDRLHHSFLSLSPCLNFF